MKAHRVFCPRGCCHSFDAVPFGSSSFPGIKITFYSRATLFLSEYSHRFCCIFCSWFHLGRFISEVWDRAEEVTCAYGQTTCWKRCPKAFWLTWFFFRARPPWAPEELAGNLCCIWAVRMERGNGSEGPPRRRCILKAVIVTCCQ